MIKILKTVFCAENEHRFLDLKQRMAKYAPKEWGKELRRRVSIHVTSSNCSE